MLGDQNGEDRMAAGGRPSAAAFDTILQFIQRYEGTVAGIHEAVGQLRVDVATLKAKFEHIEGQLETLNAREDTQSNRRFQIIVSIVGWALAAGALAAAILK